MTIQDLLNKPNRHENRPDKSEWGRQNSHLFVAKTADGNPRLYCIESFRSAALKAELAEYLADDPNLMSREVVNEYAAPSDLQKPTNN